MSKDSIPFYAQAALLDQYIHLDNPKSDPAIVRLVVNILQKKEDLRAHFFRSGPSAQWAQILWEYGFLTTPPEPEKTRNGYVLKPWDVQYFLVTVAPQVPEIVLQHVNVLNGHGWYLAQAIEALCKIPIEYSEKALSKVINWLSNPEIAEITQTEALTFISILASNAKSEEALQLFNALAAPRGEIAPYNARHTYEEVFGFGYNKSDTLELLKSCCAAELIKILENRLVESVYNEGSNVKKISWWRNTIEQTEQNVLNDYPDYVLDALRDTMLVFIKDDPTKSAKSVTRYLNDNRDIFRRLGLYLIGQHPDLFRTEIVSELLNPKNLGDIEVHHEFFLLLERGFKLLGETEKNILIRSILGGPDPGKLERIYQSYSETERPDHEKFISNWRNSWIRNRLWMIKDHLDNEAKSILDSLVEMGGKPEHPAYLTWSSGAFWIADVSPYSELELSKFSPDQLLEFMKTWKPDPNQSFGPQRVSYEGLAKELAKLICPSVEFYSGVLLDICLVRPENAAAMIDLWAKPEYDKSIPWMVVLNLFEALLKDKKVWDNELPQDFDAENWRNVRLNMARLLEISVKNDKKQAPDMLLEGVQSLLLQLVDDPDPTLDADRPQDGWFGHNDPITVALNHVRPISLTALIHCSVQMAKRDSSDESILQEDRVLPKIIIEKLEQKLNPQIEPSRAVRSVFGQYLPMLYWLDRNWLINHIDSIFPLADDEENTWLFIAAWDAYLINAYYQDIFEFMRPKYALAIEYLSRGFRTASQLNQASNLSAHILFEYLFSELTLKEFLVRGSLLADFLQKTQPEIRSRLPWTLWKICESNPKDLNTFWPKAKDLWEWRSRESTITSHSPDFNAEMAEFAQLLLVAPESETVKSMQLLLHGLLPHLRTADSYDVSWRSLETFLASQVEKEPIDVIKFYRLMCEARFNPPKWVHHSDEARKIIEKTAENSKSRIDALALIDFFAQKWRDFTFQSIYQKYAG